MSNPIMCDDDLIANLQRERDQLAAECLALSNRLKQTPEVRAIVGELRVVQDWLSDGAHSLALKRLNELLRRLDES